MDGPIITLTTDFGTRDGYAAAIKGYLLSNGAHAVIDITHDIPRGDVAHAAWLVRTALPRFPTGSIHYVVVDPGVGSARPGAAVVDRGSVFVGPDTGAFAYLQPDRIHRLEAVQAIFNGRELFAPAAAAIAARGWGAIGKLGPKVIGLAPLAWGERQRGEGRVVHVDHFGNAITDLPIEECDAPGVTVAGTYVPIAGTYADVAPGQLLAYAGTEGTLELAVRDGHAGIVRGAIVTPAWPGGAYR